MKFLLVSETTTDPPVPVNYREGPPADYMPWTRNKSFATRLTKKRALAIDRDLTKREVRYAVSAVIVRDEK